MSNVVHLVDTAYGIPVNGHDGLIDWLREWADSLASGDYGRLKSLVVIVETDEGGLATISQSQGHLDGTRLIGLLQVAAHRRCDGSARIEDLRK